MHFLHVYSFWFFQKAAKKPDFQLKIKNHHFLEKRPLILAFFQQMGSVVDSDKNTRESIDVVDEGEWWFRMMMATAVHASSGGLFLGAAAKSRHGVHHLLDDAAFSQSGHHR